MALACLVCGTEIEGRKDESTTWYCGACKSHGASKCLSCRSPVGFPKTEPIITAEQAAQSPLAERTDVRAKSVLYCEWCLHGAYFTVTEGMQSRCLLCDTTWKRTVSAVHAPTVAARGT